VPSGELSAREAGDLRATAELVVTLVLFGSSFPAFKLATERFGVGTVVGLRFALATATLIVIFRGLPALEPRMWRRLLAIGALGLGGQAVTMIAGIDAGSSTLGALVLGLEPIGVAVAAVLVARERPTPATLLGLGLGLWASPSSRASSPRASPAGGGRSPSCSSPSSSSPPTPCPCAARPAGSTPARWRS